VKFMKGSVVRAAAGRDSGGFFVVTGTDNDYCYIANGKSRKLAKPKRKNAKHLCPTDSMISINDITDKKLRTLLREFTSSECKEGN